MKTKVLALFFLCGTSVYAQEDRAWKYPTYGFGIATGVCAAGTVYHIVKWKQKNGILCKSMFTADQTEKILKSIERNKKLALYWGIATGVSALGTGISWYMWGQAPKDGESTSNPKPSTKKFDNPKPKTLNAQEKRLAHILALVDIARAKGEKRMKYDFICSAVVGSSLNTDPERERKVLEVFGVGKNNLNELTSIKTGSCLGDNFFTFVEANGGDRLGLANEFLEKYTESSDALNKNTEFFKDMPVERRGLVIKEMKEFKKFFEKKE
jgi:hypothetical protein